MQQRIVPWLVLGLFVWAIALPASAYAKGELEQKTVQGMLLYCIPVLTTLDDAHIAEIEKLPRLPPASEALYVKNSDARVFAVPDTNEHVVLLAYSSPMCAIAAKEIDPDEFMKKMHMWLGSATDFKITSNVKSPTGDIFQEYKTVINGAQLNMAVTVRRQPAANGVQVLMTTRRVGVIQ